jgi:cytochrome P450
MTSSFLQQNGWLLSSTETTSFMLTAIIATGALALAFVYTSINRRSLHDDAKDKAKKKSLPPGDIGLFILGYTPYIIFGRYLTKNGKSRDKLGSFLAEKAAQYGEIYISSIPPLSKNCIVVNSAEAVQFILSRENRGVVQEWPKSTRMLLGKSSLANITGVLHKRLRSKIIPIFQPKYLEQYAKKMNNIISTHMRKNWTLGKDLITNDEVRSIVMAISVNLVLGLDVDTSDKDRELFHRLRDLIALWFGGLFMPALQFPGSPFSKALKARKELVCIISELVQDQKQKIENHSNTPTITDDNGDKYESNQKNDGKQQDSILSVLLQPRINTGSDGEEVSYLTHEEVVDTLLTFIFAASDTSAAALSFIIKKLAKNRDILEKLKTEHEEIVAKRDKQSPTSPTKMDLDDCYNGFTYQEIENAAYTKKFIQESLRSQTIIGGLNRTLNKDLFYKDFVLPKGWNIYIDLKTMTQNSNVFKSPEDFNPDRSFEKGFLPFGYGVKMCIGHRLAMIEMSTVIHHLVLGYEWEVAPHARPDMAHFPIPKILDGLPIKITKVM